MDIKERNRENEKLDSDPMYLDSKIVEKEIEHNSISYTELIKEIIHFKDNKVWVTKKARMEAECRVNRNNNIANITINYYTFLVLAISIYTLVWDSQIGGVLTVIVSIGLFGLSNYINSMNYKENAFKYRESYLRISKLETKLESLILQQNSIEEKVRGFINIKNEYDNILELSYNHESIDYIKVAISISNYNEQLKKKFFYYKLRYTITIILLFSLPIIVTIISVMSGDK